MRIAVITGSSASGITCTKHLLSKATSSRTPNLIVRGCFRQQSKADTTRSSLSPDSFHNRTTYEVYPYMDASNIDSLRRAMEGVDCALLVTPLDYRAGMSEDSANTINMIQAAQEVGVKRIVHVGSWTVNAPNRLPVLSARFAPTEEYLETTIGDQMEWTVLRGGYFMSNFVHVHAESIKTNHEILGVPDCKIPPVDVRDIGEAAAALLGGDHDDDYQRDYHKSYIECCGPEVLNHTEIAEELSKGVGRTISYPASPNLDDWCEVTDNPIMLELYKYMADENNPGNLPFDPEAFAKVLGRLPTSLSQWAKENRVLFGGKLD